MSTRSLIAVAALLVVGCAHNPVPAERIVPLEELGSTPHGLWVVVERRDAGPLEGELLAADARELVVDDEEKPVHIPLAAVVSATVCAYRSGSAGAFWGVAGTVSTVSHGGFLIISAPIWLLTAILVGVSEHNAPIVSYPNEPVEALAKYARFPPGLPAGY